MKTMVFNLTPEQFEKKKAELSQKGITVTGNDGVIDHEGFKADYHYDGSKLTLNIDHEPHIPFVNIDKKITSWFSEA